jgi:hypothetical protein
MVAVAGFPAEYIRLFEVSSIGPDIRLSKPVPGIRPDRKKAGLSGASLLETR